MAKRVPAAPASTEEQHTGYPPTMSRSSGQLATVYAPGSLFTFEGGLGACMSMTMRNERANINPTTENLVYEQIVETLTSWTDRALGLAGDLGHDINIRQVVDQSMIHGNALQPGIEQFYFCDAKQMGYKPFPLSFACTSCGLHHSCRDVNRLADEAAEFKNDCPRGKGSCADDWEQIDVVFTHWSGEVEPLTPMTRYWDNEKRRIVELDVCQSCGGKHFLLERNSTSFSDWFFRCTNCKAVREILQRDAFTLRILRDDTVNGKANQIEWNMEPISYRASPVFYPIADRLLVFKNSQWLEKLQKGKDDELRQFLGAEYQFPGKEMTDEDRKNLLIQHGREQEWTAYTNLQNMLSALASMPNGPAMVANVQASMKKYEDSWKAEIFKVTDRGSPLLAIQINQRRDYTRRFDPTRMAVEHKTLTVERLNDMGKPDGKKACEVLTEPDVHLIPANLDAAGVETMKQQIKRRVQMLGITDIRLLRNLDVCEYSFGYSRTESGPIVTRSKGNNKDVKMPVRLRLFDRVPEMSGQHPVFCNTQTNEAFYIRLDEAAVLDWLESIGRPVDLDAPPMRLGARLIEEYQDFGRFLDGYRGDLKTSRNPYAYAYMLLHSISHQFIEIASELSGLDLGSFGEHIFVPDLAFLVYRRGATMDLGNLSSMWRNHSNPVTGNAILERMVQPEALRCGSETVCMLKGGACPDCIMIPETSCLTRNELLSRSVLIGGHAPKWDLDQSPLEKGFYDIVADRQAAKAGTP